MAQGPRDVLVSIEKKLAIDMTHKHNLMQLEIMRLFSTGMVCRLVMTQLFSYLFTVFTVSVFPPPITLFTVCITFNWPHFRNSNSAMIFV